MIILFYFILFLTGYPLSNDYFILFLTGYPATINQSIKLNPERNSWILRKNPTSRANLKETKKSNLEDVSSKFINLNAET